MKEKFVFNQSPTSWRDLQEKVKVFFNELGFNACTENICSGARFNFEADVLAEKNDLFPQKILIECKHWNSKVNQDVVFSLDSRMKDIGATNGIIVSKKGFQAGAKDSIKNLPIQLLTFDELITLYESEWYKQYVNKFLNETKYLDSDEFDNLLELDGLEIGYGFYSQSQKDAFRKIMSQYIYIFFIRTNLLSGHCTSIENYENEGVLYHFHNFSIDCVGDLFRYFFGTQQMKHFYSEIQKFITESSEGKFKDNNS